MDLDGTLTGLGPNTWATAYAIHNTYDQDSDQLLRQAKQDKDKSTTEDSNDVKERMQKVHDDCDMHVNQKPQISISLIRTRMTLK